MNLYSALLSAPYL